MLTPAQTEVLEFVRQYTGKHGYAPTLEEIGAGLGLRSKGHVHRLVEALIQKGHLVRGSSGWRQLEVVGQSDEPVLPLLGRIAAGQPIEAIPGEDTLNLSEFLLGPGRYALRVVGDSMIGAGILNGDTVVVEHCDTAQDGEIVVALIDEETATLKRLKCRKDRQIELIAENPAIAPMVYLAERVRIQGVVVGQLRAYGRGRR